MKIKELMEMATVAGGIATVSKPMGEAQKRVKVAGLEPAEKVMSGKAKKKGPYANSLSESKVKQIIKDLSELSESQFKNKYGHKKSAMLESLNEADLSEQDLIIVPGQKMKRKTGFVQHGQSRVDHEVEMARSDVLATMKNAKAIYMMLKNRSEDDGLEGWVQEKLIKANDYLNAVKEYYDEKMMQEMTGGVIAAGGVGESVVNEKFKSKQQAKLMYATAGGADTGVSKKVAKEFIKKSHGQKVGSLPKKVEKK